MSEAFRITWQVRAGLEEVSAWSALVVADSEEQARHLVWERIRSGGLRSRETSRLTVEAVRAPFVHIQKGELRSASAARSTRTSSRSSPAGWPATR